MHEEHEDHEEEEEDKLMRSSEYDNNRIKKGTTRHKKMTWGRFWFWFLWV